MRNNHSLTHIRSIYTVAHPEFQRGGCLRSGFWWKGGGGGGGGGRGGPASGPIRKVSVCVCVCVGGGGCSPLQVRYEKWRPLAHVVVIINN